MKTGDLILFYDTKFRKHRFYLVKGIFLGDVEQEGLIELESLSEKSGVAYDVLIKTTLVPEPLLRGALIYSRIAEGDK